MEDETQKDTLEQPAGEEANADEVIDDRIDGIGEDDADLGEGDDESAEDEEDQA